MRIGGRILGGCLVACALVLAAACGGDDDGGDAARATVPSSTSSTSTTSSSTTTTAPAPEFEPLLADPNLTPEEQVEQAYLYYWEVALDAFRRGDPDALASVLTGEALELRESELEELVGAGQRFEGTVEHDYAITIEGDSEATVIDAESSAVSIVDSTTGSTVQADDGEIAIWKYSMVKEDNTWRVSYIVRYQPPS